jgi:hypothetical protein
MKRTVLLAAGLFAAMATPAVAQDQRGAALEASYGLWGMMEGAVTFCSQVLKGDLSIHTANLDWVARNTLIMDELEAAREQAGEPQYRTIDWIAAGREGITAILQQAANPEEVCASWKAETEGGGYDAETFLAEQLGILRERDGL